MLIKSKSLSEINQKGFGEIIYYQAITPSQLSVPYAYARLGRGIFYAYGLIQ
jgi:hypothetical protein